MAGVVLELWACVLVTCCLASGLSSVNASTPEPQARNAPTAIEPSPASASREPDVSPITCETPVTTSSPPQSLDMSNLGLLPSLVVLCCVNILISGGAIFCSRRRQPCKTLNQMCSHCQGRSSIQADLQAFISQKSVAAGQRSSESSRIFRGDESRTYLPRGSTLHSTGNNSSYIPSTKTGSEAGDTYLYENSPSVDKDSIMESSVNTRMTEELRTVSGKCSKKHSGLLSSESGNRLESVVSSSGILDGSVGDQGNILMRVGPLLGATKTTAPPNITSIVVPPSSARPTTPPLSSPASTAANNSSNAQPIYSGVVKTSNITITPSSVSSGSSATGKSHPCSPVLVKPSTTPPLRTASPNVPPLQHVKISEQPSTDTDHSGSGFYTTAPGTGGTVTGSDGGDVFQFCSSLDEGPVSPHAKPPLGVKESKSMPRISDLRAMVTKRELSLQYSSSVQSLPVDVFSCLKCVSDSQHDSGKYTDSSISDTTTCSDTAEVRRVIRMRRAIAEHTGRTRAYTAYQHVYSGSKVTNRLFRRSSLQDESQPEASKPLKDASPYCRVKKVASGNGDENEFESDGSVSDLTDSQDVLDGQSCPSCSSPTIMLCRNRQCLSFIRLRPWLAQIAATMDMTVPDCRKGFKAPSWGTFTPTVTGGRESLDDPCYFVLHAQNSCVNMTQRDPGVPSSLDSAASARKLKQLQQQQQQQTIIPSRSHTSGEPSAHPTADLVADKQLTKQRLEFCKSIAGSEDADKQAAKRGDSGTPTDQLILPRLQEAGGGGKGTASSSASSVRARIAQQIRDEAGYSFPLDCRKAFMQASAAPSGGSSSTGSVDSSSAPSVQAASKARFSMSSSTAESSAPEMLTAIPETLSELSPLQDSSDIWDSVKLTDRVGGGGKASLLHSPLRSPSKSASPALPTGDQATTSGAGALSLSSARVREEENLNNYAQVLHTDRNGEDDGATAGSVATRRRQTWSSSDLIKLQRAAAAVCREPESSGGYQKISSLMPAIMDKPTSPDAKSLVAELPASIPDQNFLDDPQDVILDEVLSSPAPGKVRSAAGSGNADVHLRPRSATICTQGSAVRPPLPQNLSSMKRLHPNSRRTKTQQPLPPRSKVPKPSGLKLGPMVGRTLPDAHKDSGDAADTRVLMMPDLMNEVLSIDRPYCGDDDRPVQAD
eukprot:scpid19305/ scgid5720/ 